MRRTIFSVLFLFCTVSILLFGQSRAQDDQEKETGAHPYFPDIILLNQNGEKMRLYSDLLKGKVVVINSFFTSCEGVCPVLSSNMARVQDWLGERLGEGVFLISLSVDPETDTPSLLQAYARRFKARPGWYFLGGDKEKVKEAAYKLGQYVEKRESHTNVIIVGNETTGLWKKVFGLAKPEEIIKAVESVLNDKG